MLKITLIACGNKMPTWVNSAVSEFTKRLQEFVNFNLIEIPLAKRGKASDLTRILEKEAALITHTIPPNARVIALDISGESFSSEKLASKLEQLQQISSHLCFLIGGPEGLLPSVLGRADERWSLSKLTLPHPLVRIILLETLYRAWSIIHKHPYHK
ncbi:23S rRNA (pseudouridine(1915)-N(3))-methyltransferase RlmH [Legionella micdadei]|uniref:Ribosomal RNA large subunit methyltransferase H n=1 Tax=Legionella micdadei TaxID=451 RepID=A0A098GEZ8_LEGMI|nr:23S rRNA (pseudouridine(1915)-N(3))-methyltransferase RlmH [Legionella micdadei]ARG97467.1 23S rRNA (pseudouridine(1915)-N(3))-methyltransferase RlmH [Legionella micdadei]ARH00226.1 23S rRNA (pseudouridine(1915)-N(3))-methyltransferase RlmH [Legionella micdadei]KTD28362.1 rRNA large subunit methyltransferase [Legionella micdadei]NSL16989.1 23S rRNA (pseudouridine(1915)-N(3))-methyltransferase RlmH [Legionella micdadei]CEG61048.1 Ribosomal RNA large subunit methyltransferase H [Legionella mi